MRLLENTYQVSYHLPNISPVLDSETNVNAYPKHMRVRAAHAEEAIARVHDSLVETHNQNMEKAFGQSVNPILSPDAAKFFEGRDGLIFYRSDFPIMEAKVVA